MHSPAVEFAAGVYPKGIVATETAGRALRRHAWRIDALWRRCRSPFRILGSHPRTLDRAHALSDPVH
jgi:hypothetical protein